MINCRIVVLLLFTSAIVAIAHDDHSDHAHIDVGPMCQGPDLFRLPSEDDHCIRVNTSPSIAWDEVSRQCEKNLDSPDTNYTVQGFHHLRFRNRNDQDEVATIGRRWFEARNESLGVLKFWIGLTRQDETDENERLNDTRWHDPAKWRWWMIHGESSTTLSKSHGDTIKWMIRGAGETRSPKSYCAAAHLNTEDGSMLLNDFPCTARSTEIQHVLCLVHFEVIHVEVTQPSGKGPDSESGADENDDWKYALIGAGGGGLLIAIVGVSLIVLIVIRRRRRRMRSVTQHAHRSRSNRSSIGSNGSDKKKRNRRGKGRRPLRRYENVGSDSDDSSSERSLDDDPFARRKSKLSLRPVVYRSSKSSVGSKRQETKKTNQQLPIGSLKKTAIKVASLKSASSKGRASTKTTPTAGVSGVTKLSKAAPSIKGATPGSKKQPISITKKTTKATTISSKMNQK